MTHWWRCCAFAMFLPGLAWAQPVTPKANEWSFDQLVLKNGVIHKGIFLNEDETNVKFQVVQRKPGRPTVWATISFYRRDVTKVEKISDEARQDLRAKLAEIDPSSQAESKRLERIDLKPSPWEGKANAGLRYESDYFILLSDGKDEIVRRCAYRLEQVFAAYARYLPARFPGGQPVTIVVHQSWEGYLAAQPKGQEFRNPAYYDPGTNRVVCGTNLKQLGDDLLKFRLDANQQLAEIDKQEELTRALYGKKPEFERHMAPLRQQRAKIREVTQTNEKAFDRATNQLQKILHHEAFHAYVGNFVFPRGPKGQGIELPRWLNEGMAQVFETAIFEVGELRIGHAERERLERAQDLLSKKQLPPLGELLVAGPGTFVVLHGDLRPGADRAYTSAWALSMYLMFEQRVLGTTALDEFVKAINAGESAQGAFEKLVGQKLGDFESKFHAWLKLLQPDGTIRELKK